MPTPFDTTGLASRLRRLSRRMLTDVDQAYANAGLDFRTRLFPVVYALHRDGTLTVGELAAVSGFTQPAISQTLRQLEAAGHVSVSPGADARSRSVSLTSSGHSLVVELLPFWQKARNAVENLLAEAAPGFMESLNALEAALDAQPLVDRIGTARPRRASAKVELLPFSVDHKSAFRDLNLEWLRSYFQVEDYDIAQLEHPERLLEKGGEIWFARSEGGIVGTGALYCHADGEYEIAKMAVSPRSQGHGIGRLLLEKLISRFRERGGRRLLLETNSALENAIALYRSVGFVDHDPGKPSPYARANVFMIWKGGS